MPAADPSAQELVLQNIYVKDASFEAPSGPNIPTTEWNPQFGLNMNTGGSTLVADNLHEVVLTITLEAKLGERVETAEVDGGFQGAVAELDVNSPNIVQPNGTRVVSRRLACALNSITQGRRPHE